MHSLSKISSTQPLVVLDIETTGFYYNTGDEIVEVAAEKLIGFKIIDTFHSLIRPTRLVPPEAIAIHGLDNQYLKLHGREPFEVFTEFASFIGGALLVGHNIRQFDFPFIAAHFLRLGLPAPHNELLDTLEIARAQLAIPNHKLGTVAAHFGIATDGAHRAQADVAMTREVLLRLAKKVDWDCNQC
jgi:DNA polymerase III epsilon subunit family exonuclease